MLVTLPPSGVVSSAPVSGISGSPCPPPSGRNVPVHAPTVFRSLSLSNFMIIENPFAVKHSFFKLTYELDMMLHELSPSTWERQVYFCELEPYIEFLGQ